jgi:hypothetical protein
MEGLLPLIFTTIGLCLLAIQALFLWREYRIDAFRQRIFEIRDELFDYAAEGGIPFDHPAYGALRGLLNGYIRFAHKMSLTRSIAMYILRRLVPNPALDRSVSELFRPINEMPDGKAKEKLLGIQSRASDEVFLFVARPAMIFMLPPILALLAGTSIYRSIQRKRKEFTETIEIEAIESEREDILDCEAGRLHLVRP